MAQPVTLKERRGNVPLARRMTPRICVVRLCREAAPANVQQVFMSIRGLVCRIAVACIIPILSRIRPRAVYNAAEAIVATRAAIIHARMAEHIPVFLLIMALYVTVDRSWPSL